jgi:hypothetical protein
MPLKDLETIHITTILKSGWHIDIALSLNVEDRPFSVSTINEDENLRSWIVMENMLSMLQT